MPDEPLSEVANYRYSTGNYIGIIRSHFSVVAIVRAIGQTGVQECVKCNMKRLCSEICHVEKRGRQAEASIYSYPVRRG